MGYTDAQGRPEIEPGAWFGTSPPQPRRSSTTGPVPTAKPPRSEGGSSQRSNESAADAAAKPSTGDSWIGVDTPLTPAPPQHR